MQTLDEKTAFSHGFDHGNYGNAYESTDWEAFSEDFTDRSIAYYNGALLGFFSSYELHEISDEEIRDTVEALRAAHPEYD